MQKISEQHGIEATRRRLQQLDPQETDVAAYNRLLGEPGSIYPGDVRPAEGTLKKLVANQNEMIDILAALPFPLRAGS